jgi:hypothetical protein
MALLILYEIPPDLVQQSYATLVTLDKHKCKHTNCTWNETIALVPEIHPNFAPLCEVQLRSEQVYPCDHIIGELKHKVLEPVYLTHEEANADLKEIIEIISSIDWGFLRLRNPLAVMPPYNYRTLGRE